MINKRIDKLFAFHVKAKMRSSSWWARFFVQTSLQENDAAMKKFEKAAANDGYKSRCQIFHVKSFHWHINHLTVKRAISSLSVIFLAGLFKFHFCTSHSKGKKKQEWRKISCIILSNSICTSRLIESWKFDFHKFHTVNTWYR